MNAINIYTNKTELSRGLTSFILKLCEQKDRLNISLSGGSTPKAVFEYWSAQEKSALPWDKLRFFWGDERCVPPDHEMSNYGMTKQFLFDHVPVPEKNIFRIMGENDPERDAMRYGNLLAEELKIVDGVPSFDVMILGLGDDGHTASIFPNEMRLWDEEKNCVVATHPETGMKRISITGKLINRSANTIFLVTGKSKAEKIRDIVLHREKFLESYPAARVNPFGGSLFWFIDTEAAALLK